MYLRCMTGEEPSKWEQYLPWAEYRYNTAYQGSASLTPFKALYSRDPPIVIDYLEGASRKEVVNHALQERDGILRVLKKKLMQVQNRMKNQADQQRRELELEVGSWAFVKLQPYRQLSLRLRKQQKLSPRFFGPYQVEKGVEAVAYKLKLPESARLHPVFHISQLKPCRGQPLQQVTLLPLLLDQDEHQEVHSNLKDKVPSEEGVMLRSKNQLTIWTLDPLSTRRTSRGRMRRKRCKRILRHRRSR
ncbi:hypothetical protein ES332_A04G127300v1 [Gossypium tomentosum]|uniref:Tf2-1-like SH3-like domain-containing protein n=1 Tax=Gossypium tomentosum TaxID=34277 RepID=A0A5D2QXI6_GOSTO|nr:hypothetical protein ES332_A04G127300v1 [Gossypium tomentosum]